MGAAAVPRRRLRLPRRLPGSPLLAGMLLAAAAPAVSAAEVYTSRASFLAQLAPGAYTEAFTGPGVQIQPSFSFSGNGFAYVITSDPAGGNVYRNGREIGNYTSAQQLRVSFTGAPVTALGGDFFLADVDDLPVPGAVTLTLSDGTSVTWSPSIGGSNRFRGFVSGVPIASLVMAAPPDPIFNSLDNLVVGSAVPEPGTWALLALGLAALAGRRRLR